MTSAAPTAARPRVPTLLAALTALAMFAATLFAAAGHAHAQSDTISGLIVQRIGAAIVVRTDAGNLSITVTDSTKIRGTEGMLNVRGNDHPPADLIRGLPVQVATVRNGDTLTATSVTFKESDLKTAQQIAAGISTTQAQVAANSQNISSNAQRIDQVGQFTAVTRASVFFDTGSAAISAKGKQDLQALATQAKATPGYRLVIVGRADTTGNAAANAALSDRRAAAVQSYLLHECAVLPTNILPVTGLGDQTVVDDPNPPQSNAQARRVTVTVVVSKSSQAAITP